MLKARGVYFCFDEHGRLDLSGAAEVMAIVVDRAKGRQQGANVVDLGPRMRERQWRSDHTWKPTREMLRRITEDVTGLASIGQFRG